MAFNLNDYYIIECNLSHNREKIPFYIFCNEIQTQTRLKRTLGRLGDIKVSKECSYPILSVPMNYDDVKEKAESVKFEKIRSLMIKEGVSDNDLLKFTEQLRVKLGNTEPL